MTRRIALLLEHTHHPTPGEYDYRRDLMQRLLAHAGINMADCFLGYGDDPDLPAKLTTYQPHFIVLWEQHGSLLRLLGTQKRKLDDWAGYVWRTEVCVPGVKCLATYSASRIRVEMGLTGRVRFHLARVAREAATDELVVPTRHISISCSTHWDPAPSPTNYISKEEALASLQRVLELKRPVAVDIEGGCGMGPACIGFAGSATTALVIPFYDVDGCSLWSEEDELELWEAVAGVLEDEDVPKVIQNALYELFVLAWTTGIVVRGLQDDTMLKHFELYCELDKALEFQATLYTNQPYWKLEHRQVEGRYVPFRNGRRATTEEWLVYNGTDCCVTYECNEVMEAKLKPQQREHYRFNMDLLVPLTYMSLRGIRYDEAKAKERLAETQTRIYELQDQINQEAARSPDRAGLRQFYEALGVDLLTTTGTKPPVQGEGVTCPMGAVELKVTLRTGDSRGHEAGLHGGGDASGGDADSTNQTDPSPGASGVGCDGSRHAGMAQAIFGGSTQTDQSVERHDNHTTESRPAPLPCLIPLLTTAFCCCERDRRERVEVEEVTWQPMRWSRQSKKWVKAGKRQATIPPDLAGLPHHEGDETPLTDNARIAGTGLTWWKPHRRTVSKLVPVAVETFEDVQRFGLASRTAELKRALAILRMAERSGDGLLPAQRGELATLLGIHCNTESTAKGGDAQWFLYTHCGFDKQYAKDGPRKTDRLTTDTEALLRIWTKGQDPRCKLVLHLRAALTAVESLAASCDEDGRIRTAYNLVGTNTGRLASYESPTGSGFNLQTVTKRDKVLFQADEGMELYSCDLSGADSWTVAAHAARYGDRNMLDDLLARLKPAKIVALMQLYGVGTNSKTREELRVLSAEVPEEGGLYPASKATSHGSNYGMKEQTMAANILRQSYKKTGTPIVVQPAQCKRLQGFYFTRYSGVPRWQAGVLRQLKETGTLTTPFGFSRRFFGRKDDSGTLRDALSFEPQANTTWATNRMVLSLWTDPENRRPDGSLVVEPLHQIHDAAMFQGPAELRAWIKEKVQTWFNHPLVIGGTSVLIPYEAGVGPNWKDLQAL